jgi:hypothetical protein
MDTVLRILQAPGGWNHGLHLCIENLRQQGFAQAFERQRRQHA